MRVQLPSADLRGVIPGRLESVIVAAWCPIAPSKIHPDRGAEGAGRTNRLWMGTQSHFALRARERPGALAADSLELQSVVLLPAFWQRLERRGEAPRMIDLTLSRRTRDLGGFSVGRLLPSRQRRMVGPFIFFDHLGPVEFAAGISRSVDVRPHPHIGLSTVTYLFEGEIMHRDSVGSQQAIRPGEINWMTAGRGITHSERFERARLEGGKLNAIQVWAALPKEREELEPTFSHHAATELPEFREGGVRGRLLAGEVLGLRAPVATFSPLFYLHWEIGAGARTELPGGYSERALYVANGSVEVEGQSLEAGQMLIIGRSGPVRCSALSAACVMALGGEPIGQRFIEWNFVSSSEDRIRQAKADWRAGRMQLPAGDAEEFIPLPPDPCPSAPPMS